VGYSVDYSWRRIVFPLPWISAKTTFTPDAEHAGPDEACPSYGLSARWLSGRSLPIMSCVGCIPAALLPSPSALRTCRGAFHPTTVRHLTFSSPASSVTLPNCPHWVAPAPLQHFQPPASVRWHPRMLHS